ncbi:MAG: hypothetical protein DWP97_08670 [Calditrichaeota bacterium]|nr:MAG: hypothetical protein DWP97_08670 [Calditrichota bacterium]
MGRFLLFISLLLFVVILVSCSDESNPVTPPEPSADTVAPYAISDLMILDKSDNSVTLIFTVQGDDSLSGRAKLYDVRYSLSSIDSANFNAATQFTYSIQPKPGGLADTIIVTGLSGATSYYFAVKIGDEVPNWSPISNVVSTQTLIEANWTIYNTANSDIISDTVLDFKSLNTTRYFVSRNGVSKLLNNVWDTVYSTGDYLIDSVGDTTFFGSPESISLAPSGLVWLGLPIAGVAKIDDTLITIYNNQNSGLSSDAVTDVLFTNTGIWVGTTLAGLFKFDGDTTWTQYTTTDGLVFNGIESLGEASNNDIWIGMSLYGLSQFDGASFTNYNATSNNFVNRDIWDLDISITNNILMSVNLDGIYVYDGVDFTQYDTSDGLRDNTVTAVAYDNNGNIWAGTQFGLSMYDGIDWITFTTGNSELPDNFINSLALDMFGNLLIGTNNGAAILEIQ